LLNCTLQRTAKIISVGCGEAFSQAAYIILLFSLSCFKVFEQIFFWTLVNHKQLKSFCCPQRYIKAPGHFHCRDFGSAQATEIILLSSEMMMMKY
jgi:hypothetical protein